MNPGSHPAPDSLDPMAAYADFQTAPHAADIDWNDELDRIAEQTLGSSAFT